MAPEESNRRKFFETLSAGVLLGAAAKAERKNSKEKLDKEFGWFADWKTVYQTMMFQARKGQDEIGNTFSFSEETANNTTFRPGTKFETPFPAESRNLAMRLLKKGPVLNSHVHTNQAVRELRKRGRVANSNDSTQIHSPPSFEGFFDLSGNTSDLVVASSFASDVLTNQGQNAANYFSGNFDPNGLWVFQVNTDNEFIKSQAMFRRQQNRLLELLAADKDFCTDNNIDLSGIDANDIEARNNAFRVIIYHPYNFLLKSEGKNSFGQAKFSHPGLGRQFKDYQTGVNKFLTDNGYALITKEVKNLYHYLESGAWPENTPNNGNISNAASAIHRLSQLMRNFGVSMNFIESNKLSTLTPEKTLEIFNKLKNK